MTKGLARVKVLKDAFLDRMVLAYKTTLGDSNNTF